MNKILLIALLAMAGSASAQVFNATGSSDTGVFNVPVQPPEMRPGYGQEHKGLHTAVPYGRPGADCVVNPVSMSYAYTEIQTTEPVAGQVFTIPVNVLFDFDMDFVRSEGLGDLGGFYEALIDGGAQEILVVGHTDARGTDEYNLDLGLRRAGAVAAVLVGLGFDYENIEIDSAGESVPVALNENSDGSDNPDGRQLNRRVDIEIVRVQEKQVVNTEVVRRVKNPQIFHVLASNNSVACSGGIQQTIGIITGDDDRGSERGIVIMTVPR